jgi:CRISPR system Cascade subunit CasD
MSTTTLILRFDAPLMAFAAPQIDQIGNSRRFPALSQITGLLANALGWRHGDWQRLNRLQDRLRLAAVLLREGSEVQDYQTVDLGQPSLVDRGWTTRGQREDRAGANSQETHIRYRRYRADALALVALKLDPANEAPDLAALARALDEPARPLFIGRKPCLPSTPLLVGQVEAGSLKEALRAGLALNRAIGLERETRWARRLPPSVAAEWPADEPEDVVSGDGASHSNVEVVVDRRDWRNQVHGGERAIRCGTLTLPTGSSAG